MFGESKVIAAVLGLTVTAGVGLAWWASSEAAGGSPPGTSAANASAGAAPGPTNAVGTPPRRELAKREPADNSYCLVCHTNYEEEPLATVHQREKIGCADCHGSSVKHSGDEDNITPPDIMYPRANIDAACTKCHDGHDVPAVKVIARWRETCEGHADRNPAVCVDCHGKHRLAVRTRTWDKKTGKLLKDDGVRMMQKDSPATEGAAKTSK